ncbi:MAG: hypothetical protein ACKVOU_07130 [Cytophagales bacterium]
MVYDCFAFFNELDLLEIRLNELDKVVDKFVLVEATRTFQKKPKPLYFDENKARFKPFLHKIEHIIVDKYPNFFSKLRVPTAWDYDTYQKNQVAIVLKNCVPDDVILYSDIDEIPNAEKITKYTGKNGYQVFQMRHYYYYLNCLEVEPTNELQPAWWYGTVMCKYEDFKNIHHLRIQREVNKFTKNAVIEDSGWHFAYLGGVEKVIAKMNSYAHTEHNLDGFKDPVRIKELISAGKGLYGNDLKSVFQEIDQSFPKYLVENQPKFASHILNKNQ